MFTAQLEKQVGVCAICGTNRAPLAADHDHVTGHFRGILCKYCNVSLGAFNDNINWLNRAIDYLKGAEMLKGVGAKQPEVKP